MLVSFFFYFDFICWFVTFVVCFDCLLLGYLLWVCVVVYRLFSLLVAEEAALLWGVGC